VSIDQLGSIGEFVSSIAVVLSLIYVAAQIRLSSKETRLACVQRVLEASRDTIFVTATREHQELFWKALHAPDDLDEIDLQRYRLLRVAQLRNIEMAFIMNCEGTLDNETFKVFEERARILMPVYPEFRQFGNFTQRFREWLEKLASETANGA